MTTDFTTLTTATRLDAHSSAWEVPDTWQQGRGAFGGLVLATLVRALSTDVPAPLRLRALTGTLCGPAEVGPARLEVETLRIGSGSATGAVRLVQEGTVRAHAVGFFGKDRPADIHWQDRAWPAPPPWRDVPVAPVKPPLAPIFTQHVDFRIVEGVPFMGGAHRRSSTWVGLRNPGPARDAAFLVAHLDAPWPSLAVTQTAPRPIATVSFTADFLGDFDGLDPAAPLFIDLESPYARDGYAVEYRRLWGEDGRLLALNTQTIAVMR